MQGLFLTEISSRRKKIRIFHYLHLLSM